MEILQTKFILAERLYNERGSGERALSGVIAIDGELCPMNDKQYSTYAVQDAVTSVGVCAHWKYIRRKFRGNSLHISVRAFRY